MTIHANIAFIGAGNMTSAIVTGMVKAGYSPSKILLTNRSETKLNQLNDQLGVHISSDNDAAKLASHCACGQTANVSRGHKRFT